MKPILLAKRFVAGTTLASAIDTAKKLTATNRNITLDHLGEDINNEADAKKATDQYIEILRLIHKHKLHANIAVKLSQIGLAINKHITLTNLKKILTTAKKYNLVVEIDMEGSKYTERTIQLYLAILKQFPKTVIALQASLYRTPSDIKTIANHNGSVRMVKGAYKEPATRAFRDKDDVDNHYVELTEYALKNCKFTFIATHDERIIKHLKAFIAHYKIPQKNYEFQMLYGIRESLQLALAQNNRLRVYLPFGEQWFPYFYRRLRERKENIFFILKNLFRS